MKVNVTTLSPVKFIQLVAMAQAAAIEAEGNRIRIWDFAWSDFLKDFQKINDRLDMVLPATYHRGLSFQLTSERDQFKKSLDSDRTVWITLNRGSVDWFITEIIVKRPADGTIQPVNWVDHLVKHQKHLLNNLSTPGWFNQ